MAENTKPVNPQKVDYNDAVAESKIYFDGDELAALVYKAQALQIAKGVGVMLGCFTELIDAVILTGGLANSKMLTDMVIGYLHNLVRVVIIPGENEMEALALGGLRLLKGEETARTFQMK